MVTSQNPTSETDMKKFDGYFLPFVSNSPDTIRMRYSMDPSTERQLIARGEHDIGSPWLPPEVIKAMVAEGSVHLALEPGATGEYIKLNTARPPLDDVHCRLALTYAFDYATVAKLLLTVEPDYRAGHSHARRDSLRAPRLWHDHSRLRAGHGQGQGGTGAVQV